MLKKLLASVAVVAALFGLKLIGCVVPAQDEPKVDPSLGWDWLLIGVPALILLLWWQDLLRFWKRIYSRNSSGKDQKQ